MLKEFKEFAFKGNLVDMAVGFILGAGFSAVVKSLVDNVIMPPLGMLLAGINFSNIKWTIKEANGDVPEVAIKVGQFLQDFLSFTIVAFVVFIVVKKVIAGLKKEAEKPVAAPAAPTAQEKLLMEIRDLLKAQS
ncbi:large conductance mechanosensitive channel [Haloferula luteola]|uniref:Large-conductance mechanosensitive channel n=1 Tax=Haloferula luteola TaxID=595692 RepID=A0A840V396_9BACT|nr:large-conductance mechanosensitive channel protein MscL [Haloferula luteola]MBB5350134.1 large conductance mechanosensitive channel [Haloferula luteola]